MAKKKKPRGWSMFDTQSLKESSETMRDSVMDFIEELNANKYSQRVKTYYEGCYYAEITKNCERYGIAKIDKKGRLFIADKGKARWVLSNFAREGVWNPISHSEFLNHNKEFEE